MAGVCCVLAHPAAEAFAWTEPQCQNDSTCQSTAYEMRCDHQIEIFNESMSEIYTDAWKLYEAV